MLLRTLRVRPVWGSASLSVTLNDGVDADADAVASIAALNSLAGVGMAS